ncbi:MAG: hypothetical protein WBQ14_07825 [Gaiellaceae bacterium]
MEESGSTKRESGSYRPLEDGGLREMVKRATRSGEEAREPRPRRYRPSRLLRRLIGLVLYVGGLGGLGYGLVRLMHIGTCASGNTPYVIGRQCPSGTGWYVALLVGGIFAALIGAAIIDLGLTLPLGTGFTAIGAAALYGGLSAPSSAQGATAAGYTVGPIFIVMGLAHLVFAIWSRRGSSTDTEPMLSVDGLAQLIAATAPKPLQTKELSEDDQPQQGGPTWDS